MNAYLRRVFRHPFELAAVVYLIANSIRFMWIEDSEWEDVFTLAARHVVHGQDIYPMVSASRGHAFAYPPLQAMLAIPFLLFSKWPSRFIWLVINLISTVLVWRWSWKISGGKSLEISPKLDLDEAGICILGLAAAMRFVQDNLDHQQTDLVIGVLLLGGCLLWQRSRDFLAATLWGLAAAMKGPPLLLAPYLFWRGRWKSAIWMVAVAVAVNLLPDCIHRAPSGLWLEQWYRQMISPVSVVGQWHSDPLNNQSIAGAAYRLNLHGFDPRLLKYLVYGSEALIAILAAMAMNSIFKRPKTQRIAATEFALVTALALLFSPMSSKPHFSILLPAAFILARRTIKQKDYIALGCLIVSVIFADILDRQVIGAAHWETGRMIAEKAMELGSVMWVAVAMAIGCAWAIWNDRRALTNSPPTL